MIIFRLQDMRPANVNRHLAEVLRRHPALDSVLISITEERIRLRVLPIQRTAN